MQPFAVLPQQRAFHLSRTIYLPQRIASVLNGIELVQRADSSEKRQFLAIQKWNT